MTARVFVRGQASGLFSGERDLETQVSQALAPYATVRSIKATIPGLVAGVLSGQLYTYDYTIDVTLESPLSTAADVETLVRQVAESITGYPLQSITSQPATAPTPSGQAATWLDSVTNFGSGIQTDVQLLSIGLIIVLIVLVIVVGPSLVKALT